MAIEQESQLSYSYKPKGGGNIYWCFPPNQQLFMDEEDSSSLTVSLTQKH